MLTLRTPEERFTALDGFDHPPRYVHVPDGEGGSLRMGYVADGPQDGPVVLLLHGEPSWSYLYRTMLPPLARAGYRAIAPDLVGFGRSDKPTEIGDHTYARHVEWIRTFVVDALDLHEVTLVGQDWGGLIGLRLLGEHPERFARVVAANTGMPTGDHDMPEVWWAFRRTVENADDLDVGRLVRSGCQQALTDAARAAYDAPFPDESYKAGPRAMPLIVPTAPTDPATEANRAAWQVLAQLNIPFLCAFSDADPITGPMASVLRHAVPGAHGRQHATVAGAGHFLQEDAGEELARVVIEFLESS